MLTDVSAVRAYFSKLGLEQEIADIYLALYAHGPQTISALARTSGVERTRIYRLIDKLLSSNLVEVESQYKRGIIKAAPIANLRILIHEREQELKNLTDELELMEQVLSRNSISNPATRVQFYKGSEGIRQMLWNELQSKTEVVSFAYRILDEATGRAFMERWAATFEERDIHERLIINDEFVNSWHENKPQVKNQRRIGGIVYHHIPEEDFRISHSCTVYDDVTAYFHWKDKEIFGVEIHNKEIAATQRQFFELIWAKSQPETRF
jgi:sugar-specific transcriptional regulator TrmB